MIDAGSHRQPPQSAQQSLAAELLLPLLYGRRHERILVLKHARAADLPLPLAHPAHVLRLDSNSAANNAMVRCRITALPFESGTINLVVLHHLVGDGSEEVVSEALRVLSPGGDLVVSGLNSSGLRYRLGNRDKDYPGIRLNRLCQHLKSRSLNIEHCLLMGLAGLSCPGPRATWRGFGVPFADRVVVHGHHHCALSNTNILRFKRVQTAGVASVVLKSCSNRKAVS